jgi:predicted acetyltransferase
MIDVVVEKEAGIYEKLKDKTRSDAIADVKQVYKDWAKEYREGLDVANKVIWKEVNSLTD